MLGPTVAVERDGGVPAREDLWRDTPTITDSLATPFAEIIVPVAAALDGASVVAQPGLRAAGNGQMEMAS